MEFYFKTWQSVLNVGLTKNLVSWSFIIFWQRLRQTGYDYQKRSGLELRCKDLQMSRKNTKNGGKFETDVQRALIFIIN